MDNSVTNTSTSTGNFLNFTNLTYDEIKSDISDRLNADPRFENFLQSSISQTIIDIFSATTDLTNYYLERRAEEQYFDTARLKSSVILLSKILGYIVTRPIPATSSIQITIKGPLPSGLEEGDQIYFNKFETKFEHRSYSYVLTKTYKYTFTDEDIVNGIGNSDFEKVIDVAITSETDLELNADGNVPLSATEPISILQGETIVQEINGSSNTQAGKIFQKYDINEELFSNLYGIEDFSYDPETTEFNLLDGITKVGVGTSQSVALENEENLYIIDRRSLLTSTEVLEQTQSSTTAKVCLLRTKPNSNVELLFGDGNISDLGARTTSDNIYIQYFKTEGSKPNTVGVKTELLQTSNSFNIVGKPTILIGDNLEFRINSNIVGGADIESIESIKLNAPSLFFSLDRLVSRQDYVTYLKSLTSPINVNNALAWGEQEEVEALKSKGMDVQALVKLFNIVFFSEVGELYKFPLGGEYSPKDLVSSTSQDYTTTVLEGSYFVSTDTNPAYGEQTYFNVYVKKSTTSCGGGIIETLNTQEGLNSLPNVNKVITLLQKRAQLTTKNIYMSPIIQDYSIDGNVYLRNLTSLNDLRIRINNQIYSYLNTNADFNTPVYLSNIIEIIENNREVINADIGFTSVEITPGTYTPVTDISTDPDVVGTGVVDPADEADLVTLLEESIDEYVTNISSDEELTERYFYQVLVDDMYNVKLDDARYYTYRDSEYFRSFISRLNKTLKLTIRDTLMDENGNITNYSLYLEIVKLTSNITYRYKL